MPAPVLVLAQARAPATSSAVSTRSRAASPTAASAGSTSPATASVDDRWVVLKGLLNTGDVDVIAHRRAALPRRGRPPEHRARSTTSSSTTASRYIVMEYVGGATLREIARGPARRQQRRAGSAARRATRSPSCSTVLPAFGYLHQHGLLFCDFKPDNVIRTDRLAEAHRPRRACTAWTTPTSAIYGTPGYQAPEIADTGPDDPVRPLHRRAHAGRARARDVRGFQQHVRVRRCPPATTSRSSRSATRSTASSCGRPRPIPTTGSSPPTRWPISSSACCARSSPRESGKPWPEVSALFTGELRGGARRARRLARAARAARRRRRSRPPASSPRSRRRRPSPRSSSTLLAQAPERTVEVQLREARALIEAERFDDADAVLDEIAPTDPWEWRVAWYRGAGRARAGRARPRRCAEFRSVYATLPGELAPKLAMAQRGRVGGRHRATAAHWYDIVSRDRSGLHRRRRSAWRAVGSRSATSTARSRRTTGSRRRRASYVDAQVAKAEAMLDGRGAPLTVDDVRRRRRRRRPAAAPAEQQARLTAAGPHARRCELVADDGSAGNGSAPVVLGCPLTETDVRLGLESTYRELALAVARGRRAHRAGRPGQPAAAEDGLVTAAEPADVPARAGSRRPPTTGSARRAARR